MKRCFRRLLTLLLVASFLLLVACDDARDQTVRPADYGPEAAEFAVRLAETYPRREAGSPGEAGAADLITEEFTKLGYAPERLSFALPGGGTSENISIRIPGNGFTYVASGEDGALQNEANREHLGEDVNRRVYVTASYNTPDLDEETAGTQFNGISDNASGLASLLMLAKQLKQYSLGYDVVLVALGGYNADYAGARALYESLSEQDLAETDCFYEIRNIYAGTKLYAHSGWSSLLPGQKYEMRRRAYAMTDVAIEHGLIDTFGADLYLNQAGFYVDSPLDGSRVIYREFSLTPSNYRVFDAASVPIVYFDAYDYEGRGLENLSEARSPDFAETGGRVAGTRFDNTAYLSSVLGEDHLEQRVNMMAFVIAEGLMKNPPDTVQRSTVSGLK